MAWVGILRSFAAMLCIVAIMLVPPALIALATESSSFGAYVFSIAVTGLTGGGAYVASLGRRNPAGFRGALIVILLWWIVVPVFAGLPIMAEGYSFSDAYFETVSAMTTTGGWLSNETAIASVPGAIWRAELQWLGGLASLAIAAAIFIRPAFIGIDTLLPPFSRGDRDSFLRPLRNAVVSFASVYSIITLAAFSVIALAGASVFDAAILAMTTVASGGFIPHENGLAGYGPSILAPIFFFTLLGGVNFVLVARIVSGNKERLRDIETGAYLLIVIWAAVLFWVTAGAGDVVLLGPQLFNAASLVTTNGYMIGEAPPLLAVLVTAIIGAAAVSTAGGFKVLRWLVIMRRAREELRRLITPSRVFGTSRVANELGVWMHFIVFTLTLAGLLIAVSLWGHPFELGVAAATAALSNAGPLISLAEGGADGYAVFDEPLRWLLLGGMILGRLEAAVALALINRAFWRW
ncbi:potassium transporter TrkG [Hyphococcus flavus]|uniref:Potassium transporter TrkG n=1 Tax=Hyphococcus flavus TaxID=1866326 RepID=A0AAE9ZAK9_9PROT|nr:potassium transporter TrkG [Hyphococcus flavus]WDI30789.1 potassium transporter TrkG [Hyphococcus flavus]